MAEELVKVSVAGAVATLTLNRPAKHNTLRGGMVRRIHAALAAANRDEAVRVIVIQGAGDSFCAGFDFSGGLGHAAIYREEGNDPGLDVYNAANGWSPTATGRTTTTAGQAPRNNRAEGVDCPKPHPEGPDE